MKELIKQKLDQQNLLDIHKILLTAEGRRFFSWILESCGRDCQDFKGNSRDVFLAGMRNTAVILITAAKAIGIEGLDLMHKAEREYVLYQFEIKAHIEDEIKKNQGGNKHA